MKWKATNITEVYQAITDSKGHHSVGAGMSVILDVKPDDNNPYFKVEEVSKGAEKKSKSKNKEVNIE